MTERETDFIIAKIKDNGGKNVLTIVRKNITDADAPALIGEARAALAEADRAEAAQQKAAAEHEARMAEHRRAQAEREEAERAELARWREENGWNQDQRPASEPLPVAESITRARPKPKPAAKPMTPRDENAERNRQLAALEALMREQARRTPPRPSTAPPPAGTARNPAGSGSRRIRWDGRAQYCSDKCSSAWSQGAPRQEARRKRDKGMTARHPRRPGPRPSQARAAVREMFSEWSDRTFATYWHAWEQLTVLGEADHREAIELSTRPNGSLNVCKFARIAEGRAAFRVASMEEQ